MNEVFQNSTVQFQAISELRINVVSALGSPPTDPVAQRALDLFTRHVRIFGKLFRRMQRSSTARFVALPMCGDLVLYYWSKVVQATTGPPEQIAGLQRSFSANSIGSDSVGRFISGYLPGPVPCARHGSFQR